MKINNGKIKSKVILEKTWKYKYKTGNRRDPTGKVINIQQ